MIEAKEAKVLHLTLKKKWFDMILCGEKKEEYREYKDYWINRLEYYYESSGNPEDNGYWDEGMKNFPDQICFTNGYGKHRPSFTIEVLDWRLGASTHPEWGGDTVNIQFTFLLGKVLSHKHCKPLTGSELELKTGE